MKRLTWIGPVLALAAAAGLLAACGRPAGEAKAPAAAQTPVTNERASPVVWDPTVGAFEINGKALKTAKLWTFDGSTDGFTAVGSTIAPAAGQGISVVIADPTIRSPKGLNVPGAQYPLVLVRLTRTAPGAAWDGALYYATPSHSEAIGFLGKPLSGGDPKVGETTTLVYDMSRQAIGGPDWTQSVVDQIRLDLEDKAGGSFVIRQIAITESPDPAALGPGPGDRSAAAKPSAAAPAPAAKP